MLIILVAFALHLFSAPVTVDSEPLTVDVNPNQLTVDTVLTEWCQASQNIKQFDAKLTRVEYDSTFEVERRQMGRFYYRAPGQGRLDIRPIPAAKGVRFAKVAQTFPESWIWTGERVIVIDEATRTYRSASVPDKRDESNWFENWFWLARKPQPFLPLVVDLNEERLRRDFEFKLTRIEASEVRLSATPLTKEWGPLYQSIEIILDREGFQVKAIKYVDSRGTKTSVVVFSAVKINKIPPDEQDLLHPDLEKMQYQNAVLPETVKP